MPHAPTPKQRAFLLLPHREAFYGGAAGGGKSDALLAGALQYVHVPGYRALLLRRTYPELKLPGALMDRAHAWLDGSTAAWSSEDRRWTFPSGATLSFGYLEHDRDVRRYQSAEFHYVGFDELTAFSEYQYSYLNSRLRRLAGFPLPMRLRSASNPGGPGHEWVKARFVDPGDPSRPFIPAGLADNPHLDQEDYREGLAKLDPVTRAQLERGDWDIRPAGNLFRREWFEIDEHAPADLERVRYWDLAATEPERDDRGRPTTDPDYTVGLLLAMPRDRGAFWIEDVVRVRERPRRVEQLVRATAALDGPAVRIRIEEEPGASGKQAIDHYQRALAGFDVRGDRVTGPKEVRWRPLSAAAEARRIRLVRAPWNRDLIDELALAGVEGVHDDQVDAAAGAFAALTLDVEPQIFI